MLMCLYDISDVTAHASGSLAREWAHLPQSLVCYYLQLADGETEAYGLSDLLMIWHRGRDAFSHGGCCSETNTGEEEVSSITVQALVSCLPTYYWLFEGRNASLSNFILLANPQAFYEIINCLLSDGKAVSTEGHSQPRCCGVDAREVYATLCDAKSLQLCPTLCDPWTVACQAPLSMGILQAGILEWVTIFFSTRMV